MSAEEKNKLNLELLKFIIYLVTIVISVTLAYGAIDKRVTVLESEMQHKVDYIKLFEKIDLVKEDLAIKIEVEVKKLNQQNELQNNKKDLNKDGYKY